MHSLWFDFEQSYAMLTAQGWAAVLQGAKESLWQQKLRTYILRLLITPFPSRAPFKNTSLTVAVYCQAVKRSSTASAHSLGPPLPSVLMWNLFSPYSWLSWDLIGSVAFEFAAQLLLFPSTQCCYPACVHKPMGTCHSSRGSRRGLEDRWVIGAWIKGVFNFFWRYKLKAKPSLGRGYKVPYGKEFTR